MDAANPFCPLTVSLTGTHSQDTGNSGVFSHSLKCSKIIFFIYLVLGLMPLNVEELFICVCISSEGTVVRFFFTINPISQDWSPCILHKILVFNK